jgi:hypothetical protein
MKPYELARLIKEFYEEWGNEDHGWDDFGKLMQPDLFDFATWLEQQDVAANKEDRYKI